MNVTQAQALLDSLNQQDSIEPRPLSVLEFFSAKIEEYIRERRRIPTEGRPLQVCEEGTNWSREDVQPVRDLGWVVRWDRPLQVWEVYKREVEVDDRDEHQG